MPASELACFWGLAVGWFRLMLKPFFLALELMKS
jgi:hypothetical protein